MSSADASAADTSTITTIAPADDSACILNGDCYECDTAKVNPGGASYGTFWLAEYGEMYSQWTSHEFYNVNPEWYKDTFGVSKDDQVKSPVHELEKLGGKSYKQYSEAASLYMADLGMQYLVGPGYTIETGKSAKDFHYTGSLGIYVEKPTSCATGGDFNCRKEGTANQCTDVKVGGQVVSYVCSDSEVQVNPYNAYGLKTFVEKDTTDTTCDPLQGDECDQFNDLFYPSDKMNSLCAGGVSENIFGKIEDYNLDQTIKSFKNNDAYPNLSNNNRYFRYRCWAKDYGKIRDTQVADAEALQKIQKKLAGRCIPLEAANWFLIRMRKLDSTGTSVKDSTGDSIYYGGFDVCMQESVMHEMKSYSDKAKTKLISKGEALTGVDRLEYRRGFGRPTKKSLISNGNALPLYHRNGYTQQNFKSHFSTRRLRVRRALREMAVESRRIAHEAVLGTERYSVSKEEQKVLDELYAKQRKLQAREKELRSLQAQDSTSNTPDLTKLPASCYTIVQQGSDLVGQILGKGVEFNPSVPLINAATMCVQTDTQIAKSSSFSTADFGFQPLGSKSKFVTASKFAMTFQGAGNSIYCAAVQEAGTYYPIFRYSDTELAATTVTTASGACDAVDNIKESTGSVSFQLKGQTLDATLNSANADANAGDASALSATGEVIEDVGSVEVTMTFSMKDAAKADSIAKLTGGGLVGINAATAYQLNIKTEVVIDLGNCFTSKQLNDLSDFLFAIKKAIAAATGAIVNNVNIDKLTIKNEKTRNAGCAGAGRRLSLIEESYGDEGVIANRRRLADTDVESDFTVYVADKAAADAATEKIQDSATFQQTFLDTVQTEVAKSVTLSNMMTVSGMKVTDAQAMDALGSRLELTGKAATPKFEFVAIDCRELIKKGTAEEDLPELCKKKEVDFSIWGPLGPLFKTLYESNNNLTPVVVIVIAVCLIFLVIFCCILAAWWFCCRKGMKGDALKKAEHAVAQGLHLEKKGGSPKSAAAKAAAKAKTQHDRAALMASLKADASKAAAIPATQSQSSIKSEKKTEVQLDV